MRKTKREIVEMIRVWAAIESMAAGLAAGHARPDQLKQLRALFSEFGADPFARVDEYSQTNMAFHKAIIRLSGGQLISELTDNLFIHMRAIRATAMRQSDPARRSIRDHKRIIAALERRDAELAEGLVREHAGACGSH